jgi:hypothetical protein
MSGESRQRSALPDDRSRTILQRGRDEVVFEQTGHRTPAATVENALGDEEKRQRDEEAHMDRQILQDRFV